MQSSTHTLVELFKQLGLPHDFEAITAFIAAHRPLANAVRLQDASFWSESQRAFLRDDISEDADWAEMVDTLDALLRA